MSDARLLPAAPMPAAPMPVAPLLHVDQLAVQFRRYDGTSRDLVQGIRLTLDAGKTLGIVGGAGAGKSVIARALADVRAPGLSVSGRMLLHGVDVTHDRRARSLHLAAVLQDPRGTLASHINVGCQLTRCKSAQEARVTQRVIDMLDALLGKRVPHWFDRYPYQLDDASCRCIAFGSALLAAPDILIADEPLMSLDDEARRAILDALREYRLSRGMATLLFTRDSHLAASLCDQVAVLCAGRIVEQGRASALLARPSHPYTVTLLQEPGHFAAIDAASTGCAFAAHCAHREPLCPVRRPLLTHAPQWQRLRACYVEAEAVLGSHAGLAAEC